MSLSPSPSSDPATAAPRALLFQIAYSPQSLAAVEPGFEVLDNLANPRPDWFEYEPVRRYLQTQPLDEDAFYAFLSPKFGAKTGYTRADIDTLLARHGGDIDVLLLSPHPTQIAFFVNVFEQGEFLHRGLMAAAQGWVQRLGIHVPLGQLLMDTHQMVFSNYFVARPAFWREWLRLGEHLHAVCEGELSDLQQQLTAPTDYGNGQVSGVQMKIFIMERIASLLLTVQPRWRSRAADPYAHGLWPTLEMERDPTNAIVSDALKHAMRDDNWPEYAQAFSQLRRHMLTGARA